MKPWSLIVPLVVALTASRAHSAEVQVAVAANFTGPMEQIVPAFERSTGHKAVVAYGTVGKFYAQITNAAPFEVLISSDDETPNRLIADGLAIAKSRVTYAVGSLVLYSAKEGLVDDQGEILKQGAFSRLAIANPKVAVYGAAAVKVMNSQGVYTTLEPKIVLGENITQAYQFVATGNADLGFVALSQIYKDGISAKGSHWLVPKDLYPPLKQDAILLVRGEHNEAAKSLLDFLHSEPAQEIIRSFGYTL